MKLSEVHLDIADSTRTLAFYTEAMGMHLHSECESPDGSEVNYTLAYDTGAKLVLRHRRDGPREAAYHGGPSDAYWKTGITIANVDVARERLRTRGIDVTKPCQFHNIGYLCHLEDPDGYTIELLQHRFEENHVHTPPNPDLSLGHAPTLGQISLNVSDIERLFGLPGHSSFAGDGLASTGDNYINSNNSNIKIDLPDIYYIINYN